MPIMVLSGECSWPVAKVCEAVIVEGLVESTIDCKKGNFVVCSCMPNVEGNIA